MDDLATGWALVVLSPTIIQVGPRAVCSAEAEQTGVGEEITFDANGSSHLIPGRQIVKYEWDFADGTTAEGPVVTHSFAAVGTYMVTLTVTDDTQPSALTDSDSCCIFIIPPPVTPNSDPGGPYVFCLGVNEPFVIDGRGSSDPDSSIVSFAWEFDLQPIGPMPAFDDATTPTVDLTAFFTGLGPGIYDVGLKVTADDGLEDQDFTTVRVLGGNQTDCITGPPRTIVVVSDCSSTDPASHDASLVTFLRSAGFTVDTSGMNGNFREGATSPFARGNEAKLQALEDADLVLVSRCTDRLKYDGNMVRWNELETPILLMNALLAKHSRWKWFDCGWDEASPSATSIAIEPVQEAHGFVAGLVPPLAAVDLSSTPVPGQIPGPFVLPELRCAPDAGIIVARLDRRIFLLDIPQGTVFFDGGGTAGARHVLLSAWSYPGIMLNGAPAQFLDFITDDYRDLLENTIRQMLDMPPPAPPAPPPLPRNLMMVGDCNHDGGVDVSDVFSFVRVVFRSALPPGVQESGPPCGGEIEDEPNMKVLDLNKDRSVNLGDVVGLANYLFLNGSLPLPISQCVVVQDCNVGSMCP